uniref:Chaplin domain-containing protein n=1 Tax=Streptomyces rochei TaxID=1928 RepID=F2Z8X3_STRRO|nr:hypothetical protein [Streptomyces rochei]
MTARKTTTALALAGAAAAGLATAAPAEAGGLGTFLSPAFGTTCANLNTGAHAHGTTTRGSGTAGGNLAGLPIGSPLNHCGGTDTPIQATDVVDILDFGGDQAGE